MRSATTAELVRKWSGRRAACRSHLEQQGYELMEEGFDTFALRTGEDDTLARVWSRLEPAVAGVSAHEVGP